MLNPINLYLWINKNIKFVLFIIILLPANFLKCQSLLAQQIIEKVKEFNISNFKEELYIGTDRDIYITGEHVWVKVFKMDGLSHSPSDISKIIYLELLDKNNFPVRQLKVKTDICSGSSGFILPDNISTGNYLIRAYTSWMQNSSADQFSYKTISVINPFESINHVKIPSKRMVADSISFFPEGGSFISGIKTKTLIRSLDKDGNPIIIHGAVVKIGGDTVCNVETKKDGYCLVSLKPDINEKLFLLYTGLNGSVKKIPLPSVLGTGINMAIETRDTKSPFIVKIQKSKNFEFPESKLSLILFSGGIIPVIREINFEKDSLITVSRTEFPDGETQFILIDENGNQLTGRSVFKDSREHVNFAVTLKNPEFLLREKVQLEISATDLAGNPVESDFSVSVVKSDLVRSDNMNNINYFRVPGYGRYGKINGIDINDYLISKKINQINFNDISAQEEINHKFLVELESHILSGYLRKRATDEPIGNVDISLSFVGKTARCQFVKTDKTGKFNFVIKDPGLNEIVIQPLSNDFPEYYVELKQPFSNIFLKNNQTDFFLDSSKIKGINKAIISMQINNIFEQFNLKNQEVSKNNPPDFYGKPENSVRMEDYIELTSVREVIKEIIPNVYITKLDGKQSFKLINKFSQPFENRPLILVDGVLIHDIEKVLSINSRDIERADITNTRYFYSDNVFDGIVSFITKKGNLSSIEFDNSIFRQAYEGYNTRNDFYSPDYNSELSIKSHLPDFRNTLFWDPYKHTDKNGKSSVEFYTSDESDDYLIIVEGITSDGRTGVSSFPIRLKSK